MRSFALIVALVFAQQSYGQGPGDGTIRQPIYNCTNLEEGSKVEGLWVYESQKGNRHFHEVGVRAHSDQGLTEHFYFVNLVSEYGGRVQTYGTGGFRIKINRVFPQDGYFRAAARLPDFGVHSPNWQCKDVPKD